MNKISRCKVKTESVLPAFLAASGSGMVGVAGEALGGLYLRGRLGPAQGQQVLRPGGPAQPSGPAAEPQTPAAAAPAGWERAGAGALGEGLSPLGQGRPAEGGQWSWEDSTAEDSSLLGVLRGPLPCRLTAPR